MASVCDVCGKGPGFGHNVSHSHRRTNRRWNPNIQTVRTPAGGGTPMVNTTDATKGSPPKSGTVSCTIPLQPLFSGPQGSATIQGSVTGFYTPR